MTFQRAGDLNLQTLIDAPKLVNDGREIAAKVDSERQEKRDDDDAGCTFRVDGGYCCRKIRLREFKERRFHQIESTTSSHLRCHGPDAVVCCLDTGTVCEYDDSGHG